MDYKSIIIASPPRTGTVWTLNILKEIFLSQKINVVPERILRSEKESLQYHFNNIGSIKNDSISIIKIEETFLKEDDVKKTKLILNFRDPRDISISFGRFMNMENFTVDTMLRLIKSYIKWIEYYRKKFSGKQLLEINFLQISNQPLKVIKQIESFLNLKISEDIAIQIIAKFSKNNVLKIIKKKEKYIKEALGKEHAKRQSSGKITTISLQQLISESSTINEDDLVINKNNIRVFDNNTGFQTGHVSSSNYQEGDWKNLFTKSEVNVINDSFKEWFKLNKLLI